MGALKNQLVISDSLRLPISAITQTFAILGIRGSGKTNTAVVIAEEMLNVGAQVIIFDPTNAWWGLRYSHDGKQPAYSIPVLGNPATNADIPLVETSGKVLAQFAVENEASMVLSLRHMTKGARIRFATDFLETFYHLKGSSPSPVHLILDEADRFVPQRVSPDIARLMGAVDEIVRLGRNVGIGVTLISQRPAVVNKDVLSQAENVFCLRILGKHDRKALTDWAEDHESGEDIHKFIKELSGLSTGEGWIWSPFWLKKFEHVKIRQRVTFDSSKTPDFGEQIKKPKTISPIDIEELKSRMADTLESCKANDPSELKRQIVALQKQVKERPGVVTSAALSKDVIEAEFKKGFDAGVGSLRKAIDAERQAMANAIGMVNGWIGAFTEKFNEKCKPLFDSALSIHVPEVRKEQRQIAAPSIRQPVSNAPRTNRVVQSSTNGDMTGPEQRIIDAIAWFDSIGITEPENTAVAFLAGYSANGGAYNNPRGRLNQRGLLQYVSGGKIKLTEQGTSVANVPEQALTTDELQRAILNRLPGPEAKILKVIIDAYPDSLSNEECATRSGYAPSGGAYNNPRGRLRSFGLIEYAGKNQIVARPILFVD